MMKAITTSQRRAEPSSSLANGVLRWSISASEVVWHLMKEATSPLVEFQLRNAQYERTDNADGSNHNVVAVERLSGLNLLPDALYPQIIAPYLDQPRSLDDFMLRVKWHMLEAVAGIPVVDNFEVSLFPLKIQLERELGHKLFEYIFPNVGSSAFENGGFSPFMIKNMKALDGSDDEEDEDSNSPSISQSISADDDSASMDEIQAYKGPGAIELRLQPTLSLSEEGRPSRRSSHVKGLAMTPIHRSNTRLGVPDSSRQMPRPATAGSLAKKRSADSLRMLTKQPTERSLSSQSNGEERKKFGLSKGSKNGKSKEPTDDLSLMMSRASNYMTLARVKVHDVVLCMSYKGKGEHNIEDLHDFVFRLPVLEYSNKTWSNLDLALRLKKDVIKALISHAPAILGNKFSHHRPSKQQQKRFRELASSSQLLPNPNNIENPERSLAPSLNSFDSNSEYSESHSRKSMQSNASPLARSISLNSDTRGNQEQDPPLSDSRSASDVDVDSRWEVRFHVFLVAVIFYTDLLTRNHVVLSMHLVDLELLAK